MAQCQANIIPTIEQAFLTERINVETEHTSIRARHCLGRQIDRQPETWRSFHIPEQGLNFIGRLRNRQNAVLETIVFCRLGLFIFYQTGEQKSLVSVA